MAVEYRDSTSRSVGGTEQPVSCTILSTDDPLGLGRIAIYPDTWDPSKVPLTSGLWAHTEGHELQTAGCGKTRHAHHFAGERVQCQFDHGGTARLRRAETSYTGGDASAGSGSASSGGTPTYPTNVT